MIKTNNIINSLIIGIITLMQLIIIISCSGKNINNNIIDYDKSEELSKKLIENATFEYKMVISTPTPLEVGMTYYYGEEPTGDFTKIFDATIEIDDTILNGKGEVKPGTYHLKIEHEVIGFVTCLLSTNKFTFEEGKTYIQETMDNLVIRDDLGIEDSMNRGKFKLCDEFK